MGQISCIEKVSDDIPYNSIMKMDLNTISYREFLLRIYELNVIARPMTSKIGKHFVFAPIKDTESTFFWKASVRIGCLRIDSSSAKIESYRILTLRQFLEAYRLLMYQHFAVKCPSTKKPSKKTIMRKKKQKNGSKKSILFCNRVDALEKKKTELEECCICMDNKSNLMLSCAHSFCMACIEKWIVSNHTCPICRENNVKSMEDTWVIAEAPDPVEIASELQKTLFTLTSQIQ